ncbi:MAG: tripartite tricarboxylate transporter permease [Desulfarculaceae bacterium]|nr:tripartite tricarboxylate transporter permease [Desulfarculaceae bacterium]MCF8046760.1 tripartite tricarboxylate transporter permease [Desulfarculaceae bacterium]MCF8099884.1 tripartite tricarboxylate transporter permease [Desulfarculaceae bacterium]MCF8124538.1 tripartite tricarboxylate transporter permease [Desulfarculaceae bacterium]
MWENVLQGLSNFANIYNLLAIGGGMLMGVVVGAIPGLTGTMAVALALPFTFYMDPITGIILLVGIYKGAIYGGSISAILIKTPGTPAAACTVMDGYPLAQKGQARKALDMALYASCVADFFSNISLIFFAGFIASFALRFGPPEFFLLICFSLTIIAGVAGKSLIKGLISAALGLLLATVGMDLVYGSDRLTFDNPDLMGGLNFIPVLIGLFALPELIDAAVRGVTGGKSDLHRLDGGGLTRGEFMHSLKSILRGSFIGVALGAIPGIGGAPAAFMSYSEAKRGSKHPENFGHGELEGVAASEAGNNGCCGATMIPLLALGVPGDVITAVILGAFMVHNLTPGPMLFQQHLPLVYAIFVGIMLSSLMMLVMGKLSIRGFAKIADVPKQILFPVVLVLCFFGSYAVNNSMFDVLAAVFMGVLGYFMLRLGIPEAPFLIAFILGPMFEDNLRRSLLLSAGSPVIFFRSGICIFFLGLTVLSIFLLVRRSVKQRRQRSTTCDPESVTG